MIMVMGSMGMCVLGVVVVVDCGGCVVLMKMVGFVKVRLVVIKCFMIMEMIELVGY